MTPYEKSLRDALRGLLGLLQLVAGRPDCPAGIHAALTDSHRVRAAQDALDGVGEEFDCLSADAYDPDLGRPAWEPDARWHYDPEPRG